MGKQWSRCKTLGVSHAAGVNKVKPAPARKNPVTITAQPLHFEGGSGKGYSTKVHRAAYVDRELERLYPAPPIPLDHSDAYTLLIAVLLSAQCTDKRVNLITPALFARACTPEAMAEVPIEEVRAIIRPCGLSPAKSKAIVGLSKLLMEKHGGKVPRTFEELEALPGVGHKTASVVMSQAFGFPAFPVDTHIHRLAKRWKLSSGKNVEQTEADLKRLFSEDRWNPLHLRIIYYGREHCTARGCDGGTCLICRTLFPARPKAERVVK
jgi:endonuclease-3